MNAHILVVDDESGPREALEFVLQHEDQWWRVSTAADLESARRILDNPDPEKGEVDVVLTDLVMGRDEAAGMKLVDYIARKDPFLLVILFTAKSKSLNRLEAFDHGAFDCIEKNILGQAASQELIIKTRAALRFRKLALSHLESLKAAEEAQEALRKSEERYALAARGANDGLWDWDIEEGEIYFSPRWKSLLGWQEHEVGRNPDEWWQRVHEKDLPQLLSQIEDHLERGAPNFIGEYRMKHKDGSTRWMLSRGLAIRNERGRATRMAGSQTDITERKEAEEQLRHRTFYDPLTGLPNRALFLERLEYALGRASRGDGQRFVVILLGVDRFKLINESYGHAEGDRVLAGIGERLRGLLRPGDTAARHGADQFALLIEGGRGQEPARTLATRLHEVLSHPFQVGERDVMLSFSSGLVTGHGGYARSQDVLRDADIAMYRAKTEGKGRLEIFDESMRDQSVSLLHLESDLKLALERGEFHLHYQPLVYLEDGKLAGFEALLRWHHPTRGSVSPTEFIPVAELTGSILEIGQWVLDHGVHQLREWHRRYPYRADLSMSLNVSGRQFQQPDFVQDVQRCLERSGIDPKTVHLEITETVLMENQQAAVTAFDALRDLGVDLYIDDFGTGYSSISVLHSFPVAGLKVDRSFVERLRGGEADDSLVSAILAMASKRSLLTIGEGVENLEQLSVLRELGCEIGQGYLFSEAVPAHRAEALIQAGRPV